MKTSERQDLAVLRDWIIPGSHVLDLGCGDGSLLQDLQQRFAVTGYGLEIDADNIQACVAKGVSVIEQDVDQGLDNLSHAQFDTVMMTQALQAVRFPDKVLQDMLRVGREGIVTFPNFGYWRIRWQLAFNGRMPVSRALPYHWYNTPNIHLCTFKDFEILCEQLNIHILERCVVNKPGTKRWRWLPSGLARWPNAFAETAIYRLTQRRVA